MATTDSVIINLLIKEQGIVGAINSQKTLAKQTLELTKLIDNLAVRYEVDSKQIVRAIETYNNKISGGTKQGTLVEPKAIGLYKLEYENIQKIRAAQAAADREREEAQKRRMIGIQEEAIKKNEEFEREKLQTAEIQKVKNAITGASGQLSGLAGKTPYEQTKLLVPLMQELSLATGASTDEMLKLVKSMYGIDSTVIKNVSKGLHDVKNGVGDTIKEMFNLKSVMNTAFGVGMAMLIFQLQMLISKFFTDTLQQAKDLSNAIGKISIAEQVMSKEGIEVTGKDMLKIVSDLEKEFTNVSNVDMLKATGDMALRLAGTGFTPQELKGLLEVANAAKLRNPDRTLEDIMGTVSAAAMSGQVEGVRNLGGGLSVAATDVQAYALRAGIIQDINDKMTEQQKLHARAGALIEQNNKTLKETLKLQDNLANAGDKLGASWKNLTEQAAPLVDVWNAVLYDLAAILTWVTNLVVNWDKYIQQLKSSNPLVSFLVDSFLRLISLTQILARVFAPFYAMLQDAVKLYEYLSGKKISDQPSIPNLAAQDTPTGPITADMGDTSDENSKKIQNALNDLAEAMDSFGDRARNMEEDFQNSMQKMDEDFNLDRNRFLEDWQNDRQQIIADSEEAIAKKQQEYNKKKLDAEAKLQEDLRQLREKYLLNLDDALHERDARQVLRLAREYAMNKQNLLNEFALRQGGDDASHAQEMADLAKQRDDRLAQLDAERALKLKRMDEDFKIKQKRAIAEHKIEMERLEHEKNDKVRQIANSLAEQLDQSDIGAKRISDLFMGYFGSNGTINNIMQYGYDQTVAYAEAMAKRLQEIASQYSATMNAMGNSSSLSLSISSAGLNWNAIANNMSGSTSTSSTSGGSSGVHFRAKGGLDIARRATPLIFGEKEPEMALTVPLSQLSTLRGSLGAFFGGNPSGDGQLEILLTLSPDLEARVVNKSVGEVKNAIVSVRRNQK